MEPVKLTVKNFYAIADGTIDFTKFSSALIVGYYENNMLMSNGAGKCLYKDSIVYDPIANEAITIEQFVKDKRTTILGLSDNNKLAPVNVIDWHITGKKKIYKVELNSGATIIAADTHPVLTPNGPKKISELNTGEYLAEATNIPLSGNDELITTYEAFLLGVFIAGKEINEDCHLKSAIDLYDKDIVLLCLKRLGFTEENLIKKVIPRHLLGMTNECIRALLFGLWATDSFIPKLYNYSISYSSESHEAVEIIRYLLLRLNIQSIIIKNNDIDYSIIINSIDSLRIFYDKVMFYDFINNKNADFSANMSLENCDEILVSSDITWSGIKSIIEYGYDETYDITVDTCNHMYLANTMYVHNSSTFEAMSWALFNETRQTKVDDVVRWNANEASVEFEFIFDRNMYKILRRRSKIAKEGSVSLFTKENDKWINDSGSTNSETNKKIISLLKIDAKVFLNSVYFKQHDISLFANSTPSDRKEIIKSIMKLDRWDEYQKKAKSDLKVAKDQIEEQLYILRDKDSVNSITETNEKTIASIENDIFELSSVYRSMQKKIHGLFELRKECDLASLIKIKDGIDNKIEELKANGKKIQLKYLDMSKKIDDINEKIIIFNNDTNNIQNNILEINKSILNMKSKKCAYNELDDKIFACKLEKEKLGAIIKALEDTSNKVDIGQCEVCFTNITHENIEHIHKYRSEKKYETELAINNICIELLELETDYYERKKNKETIDELYVDLAYFENELTKITVQKKIIYDIKVNTEEESSIITVSLRSVIDQVKSLKIELDSINDKIAEQKLNNIDDEIDHAEDESRALARTINTKNMELGSLFKEREFIANKTKLINSANEALDELNKCKVANEQLVRFLGKEGIQSVFIESVVDELEQCANETLAHICNEPTVIRLRTQKKAGESWQETLEIDVIMNGFTQTFESMSGGEMFRISLALRIGLSELLVKKAGGEIKMLLLDEVDSPLDAHGSKSLFDNIIKGLEKKFKILVISHSDKLRDNFTDIITVNKTNDGSFITQS